MKQKNDINKILMELENLGLEYSNKSGGFFIEETKSRKIRIDSEKIQLLEGSKSFEFQKADIFLKALKSTEKNFNVKLFI
ncbi:MAG: hypothetical protein VW378_01180 [bacterium]